MLAAFLLVKAMARGPRLAALFTTGVMVGLVPTIHLSACSGARGEMDPRDKPEDDKVQLVRANDPCRRRAPIGRSGRYRARANRDSPGSKSRGVSPTSCSVRQKRLPRPGVVFAQFSAERLPAGRAEAKTTPRKSVVGEGVEADRGQCS